MKKDTERKRLLNLKKKLLNEIARKRKKESYTLKKEVGDLFDQASTERERELNFILGDLERERLGEINDALDKIDEGTYGLCEECGAKIPKRRLQSMPAARYCVACQSEIEKDIREQRGREQAEQYLRIGKTQIPETGSDFD